MHPDKITIVILTKNEERNLSKCLESIPDQYPILVVDSGSSDKTIMIAAENGCRVIERQWSGFADQRNFALHECDISTKWVLFVDADEIYISQFYDWLERVIDRDDFDVAMVPSQLIFDGKALRYTPGYPIYHPRLVRKSVNFVTNHTGHGESVAEPVRVVKAPYGYKHYFFDGNYYAWALKHVALADKEQMIGIDSGRMTTLRSRISVLFGNSPLRFILRFIYHYIIRAGFLDGRAGLNYSIMYSWYEFTKFLLSRGDNAGKQ